MVRKGKHKLVVVSNRGPYRHVTVGGRRRLVRAAGGLVAALDPVLRTRGGVWVCAREASDSHLTSQQAMGQQPYDMVTVPLSTRDRDAFYTGISNALLWPILHSLPPTIRISPTPWRSYEKANQEFANAVLASSNSGDLIWIQDFHLMLMPAMLRKVRRKARIGWFCHIPWPGSDMFSILPWRKQILEGLLGADLIGFHTQSYAENFLMCLCAFTDAQVDMKRMTAKVGPRTIRVAVAPIGVPVDELQTLAADPRVGAYAAKIRDWVSGRKILLAVDRLDYTKGITQRLHAFEQLLKSERSARERYVLLQIMVPSRTDVKAYAELKQEVDRLVGDINGRYASAGRVPIQYVYRNLSQDKLLAHYQAADVAVVTPMRDGMNLVAMEYCAARVHGGGRLVLSEFAGAANFLTDALVVNPYDIHGLSDTMRKAIDMDEEEAGLRMNGLRAAVHKLDVHRWAGDYLNMLERH